MKGCRTRFAAQQLSSWKQQTGSNQSRAGAPTAPGARRRPTFGADEAPADVDVAVVPVRLLGVKVVGADNGSAGDHLAPGSHAQVAGVVRHGAAQAPH